METSLGVIPFQSKEVFFSFTNCPKDFLLKYLITKSNIFPKIKVIQFRVKINYQKLTRENNSVPIGFDIIRTI